MKLETFDRFWYEDLDWENEIIWVQLLDEKEIKKLKKMFDSFDDADFDCIMFLREVK
jgi:hypothetical protein